MVLTAARIAGAVAVCKEEIYGFDYCRVLEVFTEQTQNSFTCKYNSQHLYCLKVAHNFISPLNVTSSNPRVSSTAEVSSPLFAAFIEPLAMNAGANKV